jgi:gamma-glutamylcyclotransferase (GGCT)/AIG2-like uncharacterized protein YtfP
MTKQYPVLVYGTLRPSGSNYDRFLGGATESEVDVYLDGFLMYGSSGCPFLVRGDRTVTATLVHIYPEQYNEIMVGLDRLEGFRSDGHPDNSYDRVLHTFTHDGETVQAWVYLCSKWLLPYISDTTPVLESGDWIQHVAAAKKADDEEWEEHLRTGV